MHLLLVILLVAVVKAILRKECLEPFILALGLGGGGAEFVWLEPELVGHLHSQSESRKQ
jgi:hypothetical protein